MGAGTAAGVLGNDDYNDIYRSVEQSKQAQMNNLLQAQQLANSGRSAAYGVAGEVAKTDPGQAAKIIANANAMYNADKNASRQFVAPGTQYVDATGNFIYNPSSNPQQDALNVRILKGLQQQDALNKAGVNQNAAARFNPNDPNYSLYQDTQNYTNAANIRAGALQDYDKKAEAYKINPTPQTKAELDAAELARNEAEVQFGRSTQAIMGGGEDYAKRLNQEDVFYGDQANRQEAWNQAMQIQQNMQPGQTTDIQRLTPSNRYVVEDPIKDMLTNNMSAEEKQSYYNAMQQQNANSWYQNLWNSIRGNNPQAVSRTPTRITP